MAATNPGGRTRILRLSLAAIAVALALLVALLLPVGEPEPQTIEAGPDTEANRNEEEPRDAEELSPDDGSISPGFQGEPLTGPPGQPQAPEVVATLYLVIDDVGNRIEDLDPYLDLNIPITFAVLPQLVASERSAGRIIQAGHEVILHLPMEAESGTYPGPGTIYIDDTSEQIAATLTANLRTVPGALGLNNHMGSRATADRKTMEASLRFARREGLFFLDSRTTHKSVAFEVAQELAIPSAERHVFLDNVREVESIREALLSGVALSKERGYAVLIGHATGPELATVLKQEIEGIAAADVRFAHLSQLMATNADIASRGAEGAGSRN